MNMKNGCINLIEKKWLRQNQAIFLRRLGRLLHEGYTLDEAIQFLALQFSDDLQGRLQEVFTRRLQEGESLYKIFSSCGFHPAAISFCYFGENNGQLPGMLETAGIILQNNREIKRKISKLLSYPSFLLLFTLTMLFLFQLIVLPQFEGLFISFSINPRGFLSFLFWLNQHPFVFIYCLLFISLFILLMFRFFWHPLSSFRKQILLARIPILGKLFQLWNTYYFSFHLGQLLKSGLSLGDCLSLLARDPEKHELKATVGIINRYLLAGGEFHEACSTISFWRKELTKIIHHGQVSGTLERELLNYSKFCLEALSEKMEMYIRFLQPVILTFIGLLIIFLYFSILFPTFQLIKNI